MSRSLSASIISFSRAPVLGARRDTLAAVVALWDIARAARVSDSANDSLQHARGAGCGQLCLVLEELTPHVLQRDS